MKHFLPFPCPCFSTSFFFFFFSPFLSTLFVVWSHPACATNICVVQRCNAFFFSISPPPFPCFSLHHSCLMYCCLFLYRAKLSFFFFLYSELNGTCFSFGGAGFFSYSFCEPVMNFHCSVCCVEREKKKDKVGRAGVILFLSRCDCFSFTDFAIFLPPVVPFCDGSVPSGHV